MIKEQNFLDIRQPLDIRQVKKGDNRKFISKFKGPYIE